MNSNMDTSGIPLTQEAISQTLNDMVKKKSIKLESEDTESKKSKRKSEKARELSAAEKFNQFKKQRIEKKGEGDIVDDLFKDFIAKKMKEIDAERGQGHSHGEGKSKGAKSVQDFSKILDKELKHISYVQPATSETGVKSEVNIKTEKDAFPSVIPLPGEPNSVVTVKKEPEELVFQGPSLPPLNKGDDDDVGDMELPVSDAVKSEPKKTAIGFKNFGIKLSLTSTELIKSGDTHKNGKRLEEGEVMSSHSEASSSSSEDEGDDDGDDGEVSGTGSVSDSEGKDKSKKKKRKKKMKHKKKKKHKGKDGEKEDVVLVVKEDKNSSKRKVSITPKSRSKSPKKHKRSRSRSRSKERRKRSRSRSRRRSRSHSKSRRRSRSGSRTRSKHRRSRSRSRHRRSRSGSRSRRRRSRSRSRRDRSPTPERFWRSRYGHFDAFRYMRDKERHRSRSRSRTPDKESDRFIAKEKKRLEDLRLKIDKAKLREIAIKNAVEMAKTGVGPNVDVTYKSGGKSVEELTDFCKRISNKHPKPFPEDSSSDEDTTQRPVSDDDELIHHPFKMKEAPIVMDIRNAKQLPVVSPADRLIKTGELRLQFPVSSGSQHRQKEWVPVEKPGPAKPGFITAPSSEPNTTEGAQATPTPVPPEDKVFEEAPQEPVDISSIISERLSAVRKLAENPHDLGAKLVLDQAQKKASQWANSRMLPGAFIGSTGANVLSHEELIGPNKKRQAWLKKVGSSVLSLQALFPSFSLDWLRN